MTTETEGYPREPKTDKQGRIIDPLTGRVLRDRQRRTSRGPFRGKSGKPHPRLAKLEARISGYEDVRNKQGFTKPGSLTK